MEESIRKKKKDILWKYIISEKRVFIIFLIHIVVSVIFIIALSSVYKYIPVPELNISQVIEEPRIWVEQFLLDETHIDNMINPISAVIFAITILGIISAIIKFWIKMFMGRYDASFMKLDDQKKQNLFSFMLGSLLFAVTYFPFLATNLFNVMYEISLNTPIRPVFVGTSLFVTLLSIVHNLRNLQDSGRGNILTYLEALFIVLLLLYYPVKEGSLFWTIIYMLFMLVITLSLMSRLETIYRNDTAIYYFENNNDKLFIHYRLDDERVVCSNVALLNQNPQRILYNISDLSGKEVKKDTSNYDKNWKEMVAELKDIKEQELRAKDTIKAERKAKKEQKKLLKQKVRKNKKEERSKINKLTKEVAEWKMKYNEAQEEIRKLRAKNDDQKETGKGA